MPMLFQYKNKVKEEADEEANEVSKEYRSGVMDPSREVAKFEKGRIVKKNVGKKLEIETMAKMMLAQKNMMTGINYLTLLWLATKQIAGNKLKNKYNWNILIS